MDRDGLDSARAAIQEIYALFRSRGRWPSFVVVDRRLDRSHDLDAQDVLSRLPRRLLRRSRLNGPFLGDDEVRLTLAGVAEDPESADDLERLVALLRWLAERERLHDPDETGQALVVTGGEIAEALSLGTDDAGLGAAARLWELLDLLPPFWTARSSSAEPLSWQLTVTREVRAYRDLQSPEELVSRVAAYWTEADVSFGAFLPNEQPTDSARAPRQEERHPGMVRPEAIDEFREITESETPEGRIVEGLRQADEKTELEPALMRIIGEVDQTPHGPTEIADLTTAHLRVFGRPAFAGIVIKGRSSRRVRAADVADQLQRAASLPSAGLLVLAAVGDIQDDAKHRAAWLAEKASIDWLVLDRGDLARLFVSYGELCPTDGAWLGGRRCSECGWQGPRHGATGAARITVLTLEDSSHAGAKRFGAHLLVPSGLQRSRVVALIREAVPRLRAENYSRSELVEAAHGHRLADVLFMFVYQDVTDRPYANWICRALWIAPELPASQRPATWGSVDTVDAALRVEWNSTYEVMASLLGDRLDKGTYLRAIDRYMAGADELVERARHLIESARLTAAEDARLSELDARIAILEGPDRSRAAPHECADLDNVFEAITGDLMNLALPFTERGRATWPASNRLRIARDALRRYDEDAERFVHERRKVR